MIEVSVFRVERMINPEQLCRGGQCANDVQIAIDKHIPMKSARKSFAPIRVGSATCTYAIAPKASAAVASVGIDARAGNEVVATSACRDRANKTRIAISLFLFIVLYSYQVFWFEWLIRGSEGSGIRALKKGQKQGLTLVVSVPR